MGLRLGVGFPFLLLALVLAEANAPVRGIFFSLLDPSARSIDREEQAADTAAAGEASRPANSGAADPATIEPMGWRAALFGAPLGFAPSALAAMDGILPHVARALPRGHSTLASSSAPGASRSRPA